MAHVKQYTRKDGTVVKEHDDKRTKKHELLAHDSLKTYDEGNGKHTAKSREQLHGKPVKLVDPRMLAHTEYMRGILKKQKASQNLISVELPPKPEEEKTFGEELSGHLKERMEADKNDAGDEKMEKPAMTKAMTSFGLPPIILTSDWWN